MPSVNDIVLIGGMLATILTAVGALYVSLSQRRKNDAETENTRSLAISAASDTAIELNKALREEIKALGEDIKSLRAEVQTLRNSNKQYERDLHKANDRIEQLEAQGVENVERIEALEADNKHLREGVDTLTLQVKEMGQEPRFVPPPPRSKKGT